MRKSISVVYCFPRSGGTLLNQCLLCAKSTVVLSEVNPAGSFFSIERQAHEWFELITAKEAATLSAKTYLVKIALVAKRCRDRKLRLCVRDWVAINFIPKLNPLVPLASGVLEQRLFLQEAGYQLREVVLLRRSREIFHSLQKHVPGFKNYSLKKFAEQYRAFLQAVSGCPKFHLEDFTRNPDPILRQICQTLDLEFPSGFKDEFHTKKSVTGNNTLQSKPPSASATRITVHMAKDPMGGRKTGRNRSIFATLDILAGYTTEINP